MVHSGYGSGRLYWLLLLVGYQKTEPLRDKSKKNYEREGEPREKSEGGRVGDPGYL